MNTLVAILRAAHCKSTHHYFAIDALDEVQTPRGKMLANMLLANYLPYLQGAKDPDNVFKDFENHVMHVRDGYWGGAAKTSEQWLVKCLKLLSETKWEEAAYSIGVLSHYFSDPFMPLHTAQSPRETIVHRPLEWSVCCAYGQIFDAASKDPQLESFTIEAGIGWLKDAVLRGATLSNQYYEPLMDDYNMDESRKNPALALGTDSKRTLSQLFTWVITGWGASLDRIANESDAPIPNVSLAMPTLIAGIEMPAKRIVAAVGSMDQRREVEKILDEYQRTGKVVRNVSAEQSTVQKVRISKPELRPPAIDIQRVEALRLTAPPVRPEPSTKAQQLKPNIVPDKPVAQVMAAPTKPTPMPAIAPPSLPAKVTHKKSAIVPSVAFSRKAIVQPSSPKVTKAASAASADASETSTAKRTRLTSISPIVDAPAIGPKTAARFIDAGYQTVGHLLQGDPERMAMQLATKWITPKLIEQWQDQARMACKIERLTAAGSGLLIMAGIRTVEQLVQHSAGEVHEMLHQVGQTAEGQRLLRDQPPPPIQKIQEWLSSAQSQAGQGRGAA